MNRSIAALAILMLLGAGLLVGPSLLDGSADESQLPLVASPTSRAGSSPPPSPGPVATLTPAPPARVALPSDFDGDGFSDLAIGSPFDLGHEGSVNVLYGSASGLTTDGNQQWTRDSPDVLGDVSPNDEFGTALASGDFNADGYADLAIGAGHGASVNPTTGAGGPASGVNVLFGSAAGLTANGNELWSIQDVPGIPADTVYPGMGSTLASGDFDGDGFADLAVGASGAERVAVLHGGTEGLENRGVVLRGAADAIVAGDLNGDGRDDLAIGATGHGQTNGSVAAFYATSAGLAGESSEQWSQDSPGVEGKSFSNDAFGSALAIGDFEGDGFADLAIGAYGEGFGCDPLCSATGAVNVVRGSADGLTAEGSRYLTQASPGVPGSAEEWDSFGRALTAGDFDGDGLDDLAIGAPGENPSRRSRPFGRGAVTILYGSGQGLGVQRAMRLDQDSPGVPDAAEPGDWFARTLRSADYDGSGEDDLAISAPRDTFDGVNHTGLVNVLYGRSGGLDAGKAQLWSQADVAILGMPGRSDYFGLGTGP